MPRFPTRVQPSFSASFGGGGADKSGRPADAFAGGAGRSVASGTRDVSGGTGAEAGTTVSPKARSSVASSVSEMSLDLSDAFCVLTFSAYVTFGCVVSYNSLASRKDMLFRAFSATTSFSFMKDAQGTNHNCLTELFCV